ncbi:MAG: DNA-protecting protein DprA, partial [Rhodospirillales bacterium]|nr:DNA-protecting protein DprA [Rhodospirillales bacterium]
GGNGLLRDGAVLVETAADVLAALPRIEGVTGYLGAAAAPPEASPDPTLPLLPSVPEAPDTAHETVRALLSADPVAVDDLVRRCQLSPSAVAAVLLDLELAGALEALPGGRVMLLPAAH